MNKIKTRDPKEIHKLCWAIVKLALSSHRCLQIKARGRNILLGPLQL